MSDPKTESAEPSELLPQSMRSVRQRNPEAEHETASWAVNDLVVVAEFHDPIYPGLVSTGKVERGGDREIDLPYLY